jgi:subtilisin-like proprotein convertase family protein
MNQRYQNNKSRSFMWLVVFFLGLWSNSAISQTILSTESGTNYNGLSGVLATTPTPSPCAVTFVIQNTNATAITLKEVDSHCKTGQNGSVQKLWYSTTSLSGAATISAPTWTLIATGTALAIPADDIYPVLTGLNFSIPAGAQYRFALESSNGVSYTNAASAPTPNTFTSGGVSLKVFDAAIGGSAVGYGGGFPSPANNPRAFTGRVILCTTTTPATAPVLSADTAICGSSAVTLRVTGGSLNNATAWKWYTGSCGGTLVGTGATLSVTPTATTTYYVRGEGGCASAPGTCAQVMVTVKPTPGAPVINTAAPLCAGGVAHLVINPFTLGTVPTPDSVTVTSATLAIAVPDNTDAGVTTSLTVPALPAGSQITSIDVTLSMTHTYPGDMIFNLVAPNGAIANLYKYNGGTFTGAAGGLVNAGWFNTVTSSRATRAYSSVTAAPYNYGVGPYAPDLLNGAVTGAVVADPAGYAATAAAMADLYSTPSGTWTLAMADGGPGDVGSLTKWSIKIRYNKFQQIPATPALWSPTATLFTDAAATALYDGVTPRLDIYAQPAVTTTYTAISTNAGCSSVPTSSTVTVNNPVDVTGNPANASICEFGTTKFAISATGTTPTYQWYVNDGTTTTALANNSNYAGVTTDTLTVKNAPASWNGYKYSCKATSVTPCTTTETSTEAVLTVNPTPVVGLSVAPYSRLLPGLTTTLSVSSTPSGSSYSWFKNDLGFATATGSSYTATIDDQGTYAVSVIDVNGCTNKTNSVVITDSVSSKLFIFPNPTSTGKFSVSYYSLKGNVLARLLTIYDSKGALVLSKSFEVGKPYDKMEVDFSTIQRGLYFVVLLDHSGNRIASDKIVVQ